MRAVNLDGSNNVVNVVMLSALADMPGAIASDTAGIGDHYNGTSFTRPTLVLDLPTEIGKFVLLVDSQVDAIYDATIGSRGPEYDVAEAAARAYKAAGYTGTVPSSVSAWATAKSWAATAAADDIISAANRLAAARDAIRAQRLLSKEQAKTAADIPALKAIQQTWASFVVTIRGQLGG